MRKIRAMNFSEATAMRNPLPTDTRRLEHQRGNARAALVMTRYLVDKYSGVIGEVELQTLLQNIVRAEGLLKEASMSEIDDALALLDNVRECIMQVPGLAVVRDED